jgi:LL-H family phage holin
MEQLIMTILTAAVQLAVIATLGYVINFLDKKIGKDKIEKYYGLAKILVMATEQELGPGNGADKKTEVMNLLKKLTCNKLTDEELSKLIEAAVKEMNIVLKQQKLEQ